MAKEKKQKTKKEVKQPQELVLDKLELKTIMYLESKIENLKLSRRVADIEWQKLLSQQSLKVQKMETDLNAAQREYEEFLATLSQKFGVDIKANYAYDDQTGKLQYVKP